MAFQALVVSQDDEAAAALEPVLSGFGVAVQRCGYPDAPLRLADEKFDAVIVDFDDQASATELLQSAASENHAITVALLTDKTKVRHVFGAGANFVLYKPISPEQASASLRSATALIKRERRRSFRVPVQLPIQVRPQDGEEMEGILLDLSDNGMDVLAAQALRPSTRLQARFTLPGPDIEIEVAGEVAWAIPNGQSGVRFIDLAENTRASLKSWVRAHAPDMPPEEPEPVSQCKLTDLSTGACYVETESPFPERSGIVLRLRAGDMEVDAEGMVRVMHPGFGMGIEFASRTEEQRGHVMKFIDFLTSQPGTMPELLITPCALTSDDVPQNPPEPGPDEVEDPLLELLRNHEPLDQEEFLQRLRQQRGTEAAAAS